MKTMCGLTSEDETIARYIGTLSTYDAIAAIRALWAHAQFDSARQLSEHSQEIVQLWTAFLSLNYRLHYQQDLDPTWGAIPTSCMKACETFFQIGEVSQAIPSLNFLRSLWSVNNGTLQVNTNILSLPNDFQEIAKQIEPPEDGYSIDVDNLYRTWVAGICLQAEAAVGDHERCKELAESLLTEARPSGAFYPEQVSWVTSRILQALGSAGYNRATNAKVSAACEWLLRTTDDGGAMANDHWESGTGGVNPPAEATAMAILGLVAVGHPRDDHRLQGPRDYLLATRDTWESESGSTLAIRALQALGEPWQTVSAQAVKLAERSQADAFKSILYDDSNHLKSLPLTGQAFADFDLVRIALEGVRANMGLFLAAIHKH